MAQHGTGAAETRYWHDTVNMVIDDGHIDAYSPTMASMPIPSGLGGSAESVDTHTSLDLCLSTWLAEIDRRC